MHKFNDLQKLSTILQKCGEEWSERPDKFSICNKKAAYRMVDCLSQEIILQLVFTS